MPRATSALATHGRTGPQAVVMTHGRFAGVHAEPVIHGQPTALFTHGRCGPAIAIMTHGRVAAGAPDSWAGAGIRLVIADDGTVTGASSFQVEAGDAAGISISGAPFLLGAITTAALWVGDTLVASMRPVPDGRSGRYGATFVLPGSITATYAPGAFVGYRIVLTSAGGDVFTPVDSAFLVWGP